MTLANTNDGAGNYLFAGTKTGAAFDDAERQRHLCRRHRHAPVQIAD